MSKRKPTKLEGIIAHAMTADTNPAEAAVATSMLVATGNPLGVEVSDVSALDVTAIVERAEKALAMATTVADMKQVRDEARTLADYLNRRGYGEGAAAKALGLVRRAEWRAGAELIRMADAGERVTETQGQLAGGTGRGQPIRAPRGGALVLHDLGISTHFSADWQRLARADSKWADYDRFVEELNSRIRGAEDGDSAVSALALTSLLAGEVYDEMPEKYRAPDQWPKLVKRITADAAALFAWYRVGEPLPTLERPDELNDKQWEKQKKDYVLALQKSPELELALKQVLSFYNRLKEQHVSTD